jgi:hypothetical protein
VHVAYAYPVYVIALHGILFPAKVRLTGRAH